MEKYSKLCSTFARIDLAPTTLKKKIQLRIFVYPAVGAQLYLSSMYIMLSADLAVTLNV